MSHLNNSSVLSISEITLFRARTSTLISSGSIFVSHLVVPSFIRDQWTLDSQFSELIFSIINFFIYRWQPIVSNSVRGSLPSTSCNSVSILQIISQNSMHFLHNSRIFDVFTPFHFNGGVLFRSLFPSIALYFFPFGMSHR